MHLNVWDAITNCLCLHCNDGYHDKMLEKHELISENAQVDIIAKLPARVITFSRVLHSFKSMERSGNVRLQF